MDLVKVEINRFRSIKNETLSFEGKGHKVLVGKNESGKSNILKALMLLSNKQEISDTDQQKSQIYSKKDNTYVRFHFSLSSDHMEEIRTRFLECFSDNNDSSGIDTQIKKFVDNYLKHIVYQYEYGDKKSCFLIPLEREGDIIKKYKKIANPISSILYLQTGSSSTLKDQGLMVLTRKEVYDKLTEITKDVIKPYKNSFPVVVWNYDSKEHDLPASVNHSNFCSNPEICIPLQNMFLLSGINKEEIKFRIPPDLSFQDLKSRLRDISNKASEKVQQIWSEFGSVKLELDYNGGKIAIGVGEGEQSFDFEERSAGFRRLLSFILLISLNSSVENTKSLILIDEPETGLHPSSASDLKKNLISLGENNMIVYATHSISMIDTDNVENNLIVTRNGLNSEVNTAKEHGISSGENIYQALGYSIYNELKKKNILLEGYHDKRVLRDFFRSNTYFKEYGICYVEGIKRIKNIIPILTLGEREYFILSDSDQSAMKIKHDEQSNISPSLWVTYKDIGIDATTIEDFYKTECFQEIVKDVFSNQKIRNLPTTTSKGRLEAVKAFLHQQEGLDQKDITKTFEQIKEECRKRCSKEFLDKEKIQKLLCCLHVYIIKQQEVT